KQELEVPFPWDIIQKEIKGYLVHSENEVLRLSGEQDPSYACRRVEFDNYLFQKTKDLGVETFPARVTDLDFGQDSVMVFSESNNIKASVVVGAFGLDDGMAKIFERKTPYRQPKFLYSLVTKIHPGDALIQEFGSYIHAFLPSSLPDIEFGAITPKGNHLSINIAGKDVDSNMMDKFLALQAVKISLPGEKQNLLHHLDYFKGKFPTLPAKGIFGNRYLMIGDAAGLNRPLKGKGINSAVITGIKAAEAIINYGISKDALHNYLKDCHELTADISYGKIIRFMNIFSAKHGYLDSIFKTAKSEPFLKQAFFNIVSGHKSYKNIWQETKSFKLMSRIIFKTLVNKFSK
ncbi:NAD(P)/FAD-dependent oxidoreductase, partial [Acidobacteriota bacterium]